MSDITSQQLVVFSHRLARSTPSRSARSTRSSAYTEPRSVASDVPWIRGVIGLRGKIIPIYDLASRIGIPVDGAEFGKIVIVETGTGQAGVVVGDVEEVLTVTADQLEAVPTADIADDRVDRQDRRPPRDPAQPGGPVRPRGRRRARRGVVPRSRGRHHRTARSESSSPTTRG